MRKGIAVCIAVMLATMLAGAGAESSATAAQKAVPVVVSLSTQMSGNLYSDMWGSNNTDSNIRNLLHGYDTIAIKPTGEYSTDPTVVRQLTVTEDTRGNRTYAFTLADGLTYNDGSPITAADYVFTLLLQCDPLISAHGGNSAHYDYLAGYENYAKGNSLRLTGVHLTDQLQFAMTVTAATLPYFYELTLGSVQPTPIQAVAPGYAVRDDGDGAYLTQTDAKGQPGTAPAPLTWELLQKTLMADDGYQHQPHITSGPYQLQEYDLENSWVVITKNPHYLGNYEGQKPELESVKLVYTTSSAALDAFESGKVQMIHRIADAGTITRVRALQADGQAQTINYIHPGYTFLGFACEQQPTDDSNVRKAIAMCIDRNTLCENLYQGNALPVYGYYGFGQWMAAQNTSALAEFDIGYDLDSARSLLVKAGYIYNEKGKAFADGKGQVRAKIDKGRLIPLELRWAKVKSDASDAVEVQLKKAAKALGFRLSITEMRFTDMLKQYYRVEGSRTYNLFYLSENFNAVFDPYNPYRTGDEWQGMVNASGLQDPQLMKAADLMRHVPGDQPETYVQNWFAFQKRWREQMPAAPICSVVYFDVCVPTIYGFTDNASTGLDRALLYATRTKPAPTDTLVPVETATP